MSVGARVPTAAAGALVAGSGVDTFLRAVDERLARLETAMKHFATNGN